MIVYFTDGTSETFDKADLDNCEENESTYLIRNEDEEIIAELGVHAIKYIKW